MFTDETEAQGFEEYQAMMNARFVQQCRNAGQEMVKEGCRRGHWPMVAAGWAAVVAAATSENERRVCTKEAKRYRKMVSAAHFAEAQAELVTRARRRMVA